MSSWEVLWTIKTLQVICVLPNLSDIWQCAEVLLLSWICSESRVVWRQHIPACPLWMKLSLLFYCSRQRSMTERCWDVFHTFFQLGAQLAAVVNNLAFLTCCWHHHSHTSLVLHSEWFFLTFFDLLFCSVPLLLLTYKAWSNLAHH